MDFLPSDSLTAIVVAHVAGTWRGAGLVLVEVLALEVVTACPSAFAFAAKGRAVQVQMLSHLAARFTDGVRVLKLKSLHHTHRIVLLRILHRFFIHRALLFMIRRCILRTLLRLFYNMLFLIVAIVSI